MPKNQTNNDSKILAYLGPYTCQKGGKGLKIWGPLNSKQFWVQGSKTLQTQDGNYIQIRNILIRSLFQICMIRWIKIRFIMSDVD